MPTKSTQIQGHFQHRCLNGLCPITTQQQQMKTKALLGDVDCGDHTNPAHSLGDVV